MLLDGLVYRRRHTSCLSAIGHEILLLLPLKLRLACAWLAEVLESSRSQVDHDVFVSCECSVSILKKPSAMRRLTVKEHLEH